MSTYLSWDELEDDDPAPSETLENRLDEEAVRLLGELAGEASDPSLLNAINDPTREKLSFLMKERANLEQRLMKLLGKAPPTKEDERKNLMFPMPIHTAESRLAERSAAREEQRMRALKRRAMERSRLRARDENLRAEYKREGERKVLQAMALQRVDQYKARERHEDWLRNLRVEESIRSRWAEQRELALRKQQQARYRLRTQFEKNNEQRRQLALEQLLLKRKADEVFHTRLDQRAQKKDDELLQERLDQRAEKRLERRSQQRLERRSQQKDDWRDEY